MASGSGSPGVNVQMDWVLEAKRENLSLFSELDLLLKALDKFFAVENLPLSQVPMSTKNFHTELEAAKDVIIKVLAILETVIPQHKKNVLMFKKFAETRLLSGKKSDAFREDLYKQDTREKSIFLLYDSFMNLRTIASDLLKTPSISFASYRNVGQLINREIRENIHFNPFTHKIDPEIDCIENSKISSVVKGLKGKEARKAVSIVFLHLFRLLRYLKHIDRSAKQNLMSMHVSLVILTLLRSEFNMFRSFVEDFSKKTKDKNLSMLMQALSYQIVMETKRIYTQELRDVLEKKSPKYLRSKIHNCHGILNNLIEQTIIQLAQFWEPDIKGDEVFTFFITKTEQSMKLREDLFVTIKLISHLEEGKGSGEEADMRMRAVMSYLDYFESFTFKLLRQSDYDEFLNQFTAVRAAHYKGNPAKFLEECHKLKILISTTIRLVEGRAELKDRPMDVEKAMGVVKQYFSIM